jgi:hypothetical protein
LKRALLFFLSFVAVAIIIYAMAIIPNFNAFKTLFQNAEGMSEGSEYVANTYSLADLTGFIGNKPEHVSIVSISVDEPDSNLYYEENSPRTMGSLGNLILLYAYVQAVESAQLDPNEDLQLAELSRFRLPLISQNAHDGASEQLVTEESPTFTLEDAVHAMVEFNDLVIADFLWAKLGEPALKASLRELKDSLNLKVTELPLPNAALYMAIAEPASFVPDYSPKNNSLRTDSTLRVAFHSQVLENFYLKTAKDEQFSAVQAAFKENRINQNFMRERDALALFPQTTAFELAQIMRFLLLDDRLDTKLQTRVLNALGWPNGSTTVARSFESYYAQYDSRMGLLSGVDFGTSIYTGEQRIQVVLFDEIPVAFWHHMSANHMQEDFQQRLIWDPALFQTTKLAL